MNENSFGLLLGEFLDKAIMALDDIATVAEEFVGKMAEKDKEFMHPADLKRIENIGENIDTFFTKSLGQPSPSRQRKKPASPKVQKAKEKNAKKATEIITDKSKASGKDIPMKEPFSSSDFISDDSSSEIMATQTTGKAAGFSSNHYKVTEASDSAGENEEEDEEEAYNEETNNSSDYSDV